MKPVTQDGIPKGRASRMEQEPQKVQVDVTVSLQESKPAAAVGRPAGEPSLESLIEKIDSERALFYLSRGLKIE